MLLFKLGTCLLLDVWYLPSVGTCIVIYIYIMWGPLAQSVEPGNLDREVPGSSLGRGGGLCPWAINFIHIALTAEVGDASPMWRKG